MRILIAEDNADHASIFRQLLSPYGECVVASDGEAAFKEFCDSWERGEPFGLICLDVLMPKMNGHETLRAIRKWEAEMGIGGFEGVRVVMTTALEDDENIEEAIKAGCEGYVFKSAGGKRLLKQLRDLGLIKDTE